MTYEEAKEQLDMAIEVWRGEMAVALLKAIEAVEKQIPKKPRRVDKNKTFDGNWTKVCPTCGNVLLERITTEDSSYPRFYWMEHYCKCGQKLDWSN